VSLALRTLVILVVALAAGMRAQDTITVASKNFTESVLLGEIMAQTLEEHTDLVVERRLNLGGTVICWDALRGGEVDVYADYSGTGWAVLLGETTKVTDPLRTFLQVRQRCAAEHGVLWLDPFGLENSYALAMREDRAEELGVRRVSDLLDHMAELTAGFSIEFGNRQDGYIGLAEAYGLELGRVRVLEHGLAYEGIQSGAIDITDAYTTDAKLLRYALRTLEDDRGFFPPYHAAPVVNAAVAGRHPEIEAALERLAFQIPNEAAQAMNYAIEARDHDVADVARAFLERAGLVEGVDPAAAAARADLEELLAETPEPGSETSQRAGLVELFSDGAGELLGQTLVHIYLTFRAVALACLFAIPLGLFASRRPRLRQLALGTAGIMQTVPSLALLAFMIPVFGLTATSAIAALFLYAILPILRNTVAGLASVPPELIDAARGMGMRPGEILRMVELPMAMGTIMAGVRTATVISIGVATLAAFIGAGGLGSPIVEGLYLNDSNLILSGAIPAAILAVLTDLLLGRVEHWLEPEGLRLAASRGA